MLGIGEGLRSFADEEGTTMSAFIKLHIARVDRMQRAIANYTECWIRTNTIVAVWRVDDDVHLLYGTTFIQTGTQQNDAVAGQYVRETPEEIIAMLTRKESYIPLSKR